MKKVVIAQNISFYAWHMRLNLAKALQEAGYEVIFLSSSDPFIASQPTQDHPPHDIYSQKLSEMFEYHDIPIHRKGTNPFTDLKTLYAFYRCYQSIQPDIVLHYTAKPNIYGTLAAKWINIPVINNIAGLGTLFIKEGPLTQLIKQLYKFSQRDADRIFFQNPDDQSLFLKNHLIQPQQSALLPGSGVDLQTFHPLPSKAHKEFRFLLIARLLRDKGIIEYIEAIKIIQAKYNNVQFQLLGALDEANQTAISSKELEAWIDKGLITYLGVSDDVPSVIAQSDCVVLPSYREGTPRSLLEAAAMEKPIITTNTVGCKEVVEDGINGYLCRVRDANDLAKKLEKMLLLPPQARQIMGKKGREKMQRSFDERIVFDHYLHAIKEVLSCNS